MSNLIEMKIELFNYLKSLPNVTEVNPVQLQTKCFLCGDGTHGKRRFGIKIDTNNPTEPVLYNCFNCGEFGVFRPDMINEIGGDSSEMLSLVRQINKKSSTVCDGKKRIYKNDKIIGIEKPPIYNKPSYTDKIKYIYDRIGYKIPFDYFDKLNIIFSISDFLKLNEIEPRNNMTWLLDRDYVGFLSRNNEFLILRDITNKNKMRYIKYNLFGVYDNSNNFYTIQNRINPLTMEDIHIDITEGPFDIISLLFNHFECNDTNHIMIATCNGSFTNPLRYFIKKGILGYNVIVNCYQDNDTKIDFKKMKSQFIPYIKQFNVFYNTIGKDFGVPRDKFNIDSLIV